jgi:hypothetical protein
MIICYIMLVASLMTVLITVAVFAQSEEVPAALTNTTMAFPYPGDSAGRGQFDVALRNWVALVQRMQTISPVVVEISHNVTVVLVSVIAL